MEGTVLLEVLVDETGAVAHAEVRSSIPEFDDAALRCVREWQSEPARDETGRPVPTIVHAPMSFRIY